MILDVGVLKGLHGEPTVVYMWDELFVFTSNFRNPAGRNFSFTDTVGSPSPSGCQEFRIQRVQCFHSKTVVMEGRKVNGPYNPFSGH